MPECMLVRDIENITKGGKAMRQITQQELQSLPSYLHLEQAITYPYDYRKKCEPFTRDGFVAVAAIYNLSAWSGWKSSSLGYQDRQVANAIHNIPLYELMKINKGRRSNQPALFPDGTELLEGANRKGANSRGDLINPKINPSAS